MSEASRQLPVFVYGTLRPGQPNWKRLLSGRTERVVAGRLSGAVLLDCGHYPAAVERPGPGLVVGEVVWMKPVAWPMVLSALDDLEGYSAGDPDRLYDRVVRPVETADGPVDCWVYVAGRRIAGGLPAVTGGDWIAYCADRATSPTSPPGVRKAPDVRSSGGVSALGPPAGGGLGDDLRNTVDAGLGPA